MCGIKGNMCFVCVVFFLLFVCFCCCSLGPTTFLGSEHDFNMLDRILVG